jgi:hypothetical protein
MEEVRLQIRFVFEGKPQLIIIGIPLALTLEC